MYLFITKDITGAVEMWKHRPKIDQNGFFKPFINEVGTEVMDNLFSSLLEKGDCVRIEVKIPTDGENSIKKPVVKRAQTFKKMNYK